MLWSIEFLVVLSVAFVALAMAIPEDAYGPFSTGSAFRPAIGYSLTFIAFSLASLPGGLLVDLRGPKRALLAGTFPAHLIGGGHLRTGFLSVLVGTGQGRGRGYALVTLVLGMLITGFLWPAGRHSSLGHLDAGRLPALRTEALRPSTALGAT